MSRKELIAQLAFDNVRRKTQFDSVSIMPIYTASNFVKTKVPDTINAWVKLDLCNRDDIQDCYYLSHVYDNYTSLSVFNPTELEFRIFLTVNGNSVLTFYDILPGNNVFELFINDFPRCQLDYNQIHLVVRLKNSSMDFLTESKVNFGSLSSDAKLLQTQARVEIYDLDKKNQLKNIRTMILGHKNELHVIKDGTVDESWYFGREVTEFTTRRYAT